jgi:hypothetical protein
MRRNFFVANLGAAALIALLLSACGDDDKGSVIATGSPGASALAAAQASGCKLVTKEEAEAVLGQVIEAPTGVDTPLGQKPGDILAGFLQSSCVYQGASDKGVQSILTTITPIPGAPTPITSPRNAGEYYENLKSGFGDVQAVDGLGDEAYANKLGLNLRKGDIYMNVLVVRAVAGALTTSNPTDLDAEKAMAQKALARLP